MFIDVPFNTVETYLFGALALTLVGGIVRRIVKTEFRAKECVFCGRKVAADEHAHHLEICGLRKLGGIHSEDIANVARQT